MTGRELIVYILENHLEDEEIVQDGKYIGFKSLTEVAEETGVGVETVRIWCVLKQIPYTIIGGAYCIPGNYKPPVDITK